jgi:hypothetical protein
VVRSKELDVNRLMERRRRLGTTMKGCLGWRRPLEELFNGDQSLSSTRCWELTLIASLFLSIPKVTNTGLEVSDTGLEVSGASLHVFSANGDVR